MPFVHSKPFSFPTLKDIYPTQYVYAVVWQKTQHIRDKTRAWPRTELSNPKPFQHSLDKYFQGGRWQLRDLSSTTQHSTFPLQRFVQTLPYPTLPYTYTIFYILKRFQYESTFRYIPTQCLISPRSALNLSLDASNRDGQIGKRFAPTASKCT